MSAPKQPAGRAARRANDDGVQAADNLISSSVAARIERAVARQPHDDVRCVHLFDAYYRCNWWAPVGADLHRNQAEWVIGALSRVRKSCFLSATLKDQRLVIEEIDRNGLRAVLAIDEGLVIEQRKQGSVASAAPVDPVGFPSAGNPEDDEGQALP